MRVTLAVMLLAPTMALAGVAALDSATPAAKAPAPAATRPSVQAPAGTVQIRCWQDGRLLFEENGVQMPEGSRYATAISGADREGRPVYVAETRNATCLIRPAATPERGAWPR